MPEKFIIRLTNVGESPVDLNTMTSEGLAIFMELVAAMQAIAESIVPKELLTFSLRPGSSVGEIEAPTEQMQAIYSEIKAANEGNSRNEAVTKNLRTIQSRSKEENVDF